MLHFLRAGTLGISHFSMAIVVIILGVTLPMSLCTRRHTFLKDLSFLGDFDVYLKGRAGFGNVKSYDHLIYTF